MKKAFLVSIVLLLLIGCTSGMTKHREQIRNGLLTVGLNREAFLKEWGMPDRTYVISSDEVAKLSVLWGSNFGSGGFFKGKVPLDVWEYQKKEVTLIFNGIVLVGWKTEKTRKELEKESPKGTEGTTKELQKEGTKKIQEDYVIVTELRAGGRGQYYHRSGCPRISGTASLYLSKLTVEEALKKGYTACPICNP